MLLFVWECSCGAVCSFSWFHSCFHCFCFIAVMLCLGCCFGGTVWLLWWCVLVVGFIVVVIVLLFVCFGFLLGSVFYYNYGDYLLLIGCLFLVVVGVCLCSLSRSGCCHVLVASFVSFVVLLLNCCGFHCGSFGWLLCWCDEEQ